MKEGAKVNLVDLDEILGVAIAAINRNHRVLLIDTSGLGATRVMERLIALGAPPHRLGSITFLRSGQETLAGVLGGRHQAVVTLAA